MWASMKFLPTKLYMAPIFPCYPSGTILLRTKAICYSKHMRRLISISVNYMLGNRYISYTIITSTSTLLLPSLNK